MRSADKVDTESSMPKLQSRCAGIEAPSRNEYWEIKIDYLVCGKNVVVATATASTPET